jgi:3-oxoacyl-[acyl-carrier-protein] synthase-1
VNASAELWDGTQSDLVVCGASAINALGFSSHQSWAFWRAEANGFSESPFRCANGTLATFAAVQTLPPRMQGVERVSSLAVRALEQLRAPLAALSVAKVLVAAGISERFNSVTANSLNAQGKQLEVRLKSVLDKSAPAPALRLIARGHASLAAAVAQAGAVLAAQTFDAAVVGGADSYYDADAIDELIEQKRLFDGRNPDSLIPGEGAAFLVLARAAVAKRARLPVLGRIEAAGVAREPNTMLSSRPCSSQGLTWAMRSVIEPLKARRRKLDWIFADLTNEHYRGQEFQLALPRNLTPGGLDDGGRSFQPVARNPLRMDFIPERFGDIGAATMPTAAVVATEAFARGDPSAETCLLLGSSVGADRGAVLISSVPSA